MEGERIRILLIGSGGREHALAWKLSQSPRVEFIKVVPGNGGTAAGLPKVQNVADVNPEDFSSLLAFASDNKVNLVVPGPEMFLVAGIGDLVRAAGIRCFGPTKAAARMEGSKTFAKDFMMRHHIPTARYMNFNSYERARDHLDELSYNVVIKATGLAAGKGVILPSSKEEAHAALREIMLEKKYGSAGDEVVIEEFLVGQELSFLSFSDGYTIQTLPPGEDHKQVYDSDKGPNTGGMGVYAPSPVATPELVEEVHRAILQPTIDGMRKEKMPFVGMLFTGLMVTKDGPRVLEYNVRFGDPETQTMLPLMDADLAEVMIACTDSYLDAVNVKAHNSFACTVVASAGGYPGPYVRGDRISLRSPPPDTNIFHAGTKGPAPDKTKYEGPPSLQPLTSEGGHFHGSQGIKSSDNLTTSGGRVIAATSTGRTLQDAINQAYKGISTIQFANMHYRTDIGKKGLDVQSALEKVKNGDRLTYALAGVSIAAGNTLVERIKPLVASTARAGASAELGGFGGIFDLAGAGYTSPPYLVVGTDGVGTKLKIAQAIGKHDTIGIDLVAMNVNDLIVQGAEALLFLDTYSCGKLDPDVAVEVVRGICAGCREAGCALVGGETAEMSGLFLDDNAYDIVGSTLGAIPKDKKVLPEKADMRAGDILLGLASNGCHSNGFSLIRKVIERSGLSYDDEAPWAKGELIGESLLTPTRIYMKPLLTVIHEDLVKGMAHITGGGLVENVPRMLPQDLAAEMDVTTWQVPSVLQWLKDQGRIDNEEFSRVFNTGLGMVLVVSPENAEATIIRLRQVGETIDVVGKLIERKGEERCILTNLASWD